ncbi:MAG: hypothetical protein H5T84_10925 [Thermoleophilia bacterium]|nr:hypothetical protein [Thermoleophilia bacterium]
MSWWPGNIRRGKVHVHHVVVGLPLLFGIGVVEFAVRPGPPWVEILALLFGGAAAAVFDEFALVLHLRDVYWSEEGRHSLVAVFWAASFTVFMAIGLIPLGYSDPLSQAAILEWVALGVVLLNLTFVAMAFLKGKFWMGWIGLFVPLVAFVAAVRLARLSSLWARWRYASRPQKMKRAWNRAQRFDQRWGHWQRQLANLIAGLPGEARSEQAVAGVEPTPPWAGQSCSADEDNCDVPCDLSRSPADPVNWLPEELVDTH